MKFPIWNNTPFLSHSHIVGCPGSPYTCILCVSCVAQFYVWVIQVTGVFSKQQHENINVFTVDLWEIISLILTILLECGLLILIKINYAGLLRYKFIKMINSIHLENSFVLLKWIIFIVSSLTDFGILIIHECSSDRGLLKPVPVCYQFCEWNYMYKNITSGPSYRTAGLYFRVIWQEKYLQFSSNEARSDWHHFSPSRSASK